MPQSSRSPAPVVAIGLSPAWQTIMRFRSIEPGQVNRATEVVRCASGKVLNVAVALAHLGAPCRAVTLLGGPAGASMAAECETLGIELVPVPTATATRGCTTLLDEAAGRTTELVEEASPIAPAEFVRFLAAAREALAGAAAAVLSGSLPEGAPTTVYDDILGATDRPVVIDARGPELLAALGRRPLLVKPNREELARTFGGPIGDDGALRDAMGRLLGAGARWALVTDGPRPALALGPGGRCLRLAPPHLGSVVNPIGCGDCLAAGFADSIAGGDDVETALRRGMACAAANCATLLAGRLDREEVDRLCRDVQVIPLD